jgi:uncharacterized protein
MNAIFVDTWAWYALTDTGDSNHLIAQIANEELQDAGYTLITTNFVVEETLTLVRYNLGHAAAVRFWHLLQDLIADGLVEYVRIEAVQEASAWQIFERYNDQDFSFTDCTSFAVMRLRNLTEVFTGDHHFLIMGFILKP